MKSLALVALIAVPRPAIALIADHLPRFSWRKLLRACLQVLFIAFCGACFGPLFMVLMFVGNS